MTITDPWLSRLRAAQGTPRANRLLPAPSYQALIGLAFIQGETGSEKLTPKLLNKAACGAVDLAEVHGKPVSRGWSVDEAWEDAFTPTQELVPFDLAQARIAGDLVTHTRTLGLSLGDRVSRIFAEQ